jgi:mannose-6-phosphate isomerase-like protein (cupin superfamily)
VPVKIAGGVPDAIAPDGSEIHFRILDARRASLVEVVLPPGRTSRPVRHRTVEEIWYFLAGAGEVWVAGETRPVGPGDTVVIPTGAAFQFRAHGPEPLRFLCYTSPPWPGEEEAEPVAEGGLGPPSV